MDFVDVVSHLEIPPAPPGYRYLDFLGGEKELRCFLVPQDMPRCIFMERHSDLLDASLSPIYSHKGICVRQDASYALPGFYIVSLTEFYPAIDIMDEATHLRLSFIIRSVRSGMRQILGINYIHLHYEEKSDPSCNVHYWVMPVIDSKTGTAAAIMRLNIREYLSAFRFTEQKDTIYHYNRMMVNYFEHTRLLQRDDTLVNTLLKQNDSLV